MIIACTIIYNNKYLCKYLLGSVHSMKLDIAQEFESSEDDDDNDDEGPDKGQKEKKRVSQAAGGLEKEMLEMSEETHL